MPKLMLVEDDNNLREIYEARLQAEGYEIVSAKDGEEGLAVAKAEKPDLVISDVMMPKISGFEMLDILRNTDGLKNVKVIMLTALGQSDDQQRADKLGADRYLVKSQVTLEDIVKSAHELLEDEPADEPATTFPSAADSTPPAAATAPAAAPAPEPAATPPAPTPPATAVPEPTLPPAVEPATPAPAASAPVSTPPVVDNAPVTPDPVTTPEPTATPPPAAPVEPPVEEPATPAPTEPVEEAVETPAPAEPTAAESVPEATPPAEPAAAADATSEEPSTDQAASTSDEEAEVDDQIENFVSGATTDANTPTAEFNSDQPATPVVPASTEATPPAEPIASDAPAPTAAAAETSENNDELVNSAIDDLSNQSDQPEAGAEDKPSIESTTPTTEPAAESSDDKKDEEAAKVNDGSTVTGKKVIQPLSSTDRKPDINELYALEQAKESAINPSAEQAKVVTSDNTDKKSDSADPGNIAL
jgi:CheY-like chemotaxis protein